MTKVLRPSPPLAPRPGGLGWSRTDWIFVGLAIVVIFLAYAPVWRAGFIWDDDSHLTANPRIIGPEGFKEIWTTPEANYFPLVLTTFWVQHALWGLNPLPYHLVSVAFNVVAVILLWRLLRRLQVPGAALGALLWGLHPVQAESVAWISELKNTQSAIFYLLAFSAFVRWLERLGSPTFKPALCYYGASLGCAVLGLLSKPSTVMLPVALGLVWWWHSPTWSWRRAALWLAPFFLLSAAASLWTIWEQKYHSMAQGAEWAATPAERIVLAGRVVWFYLGKLGWPHPLIFIYPRWTLGTDFLAWLPTFATVAGLAGLWACRARAWGKHAFFTAAWFVVTLFPVLGFFDVYFFRYSFVGDHFQHLASIAPLALLGAGVASFAERTAGRAALRARQLAGGALVAVLAVLTFQQAGIYRDSPTLWRDTLARNPGAWIASNNLGIHYFAEGRDQEALELYAAAVRLRPDVADIHVNLGNSLLRLRRYPEAIAALKEGVRLQPNLPAAQNSLGLALASDGRPEEAIPHYEAALRARPNYPEAHFNVANSLLGTGRTQEALPHLEALIRLQPTVAEHYQKLGQVLLLLQRPEETLTAWNTALQLSPNQAALLLDAGNLTLATLRRPTDAIRYYETAARLSPDSLQAFQGWGAALFLSGKAADAIPVYERMARLDPGNAQIQCDLGVVLAKSGRTKEALAAYEKALRLDPHHPAASRYRADLQAQFQAPGSR